MKLTKRELWLMRNAFSAGEQRRGKFSFDGWLADDFRGQSEDKFLAEDAPRDDAIAAAVSAEREACSERLVVIADKIRCNVLWPTATRNAISGMVRDEARWMKRGGVPAEICQNCDSELPEGCGGLFSDQKECAKAKP
jgi:hypothetical protein